MSSPQVRITSPSHSDRRLWRASLSDRPSGRWLPAALQDHLSCTARLLARLDALGLDGIQPRDGRTTNDRAPDATVTLARLVDRLRAEDGRLRELTQRLDAAGPTSAGDHP
jgi:hypothetical protein